MTVFAAITISITMKQGTKFISMTKYVMGRVDIKVC